MDFGVTIMNLIADKNFGPKEKRIGVFGPYPNGGREIIDKVAKMVCSCNFIAITADGFYLPEDCGVLQNINEIINLPVRGIQELLPGHIFFRHFPRIVDKAIFFENDERGQVTELYGCHDYNIPCLGFIIHEKLRNKTNCLFLRRKRDYSICDATSEQLCYHNFQNIFCPFYDSINIPWFSKQLFFENENQLIAVKKLENLRPAIEEFISK